VCLENIQVMFLDVHLDWNRPRFELPVILMCGLGCFCHRRRGDTEDRERQELYLHRLVELITNSNVCRLFNVVLKLMCTEIDSYRPACMILYDAHGPSAHAGKCQEIVELPVLSGNHDSF
jgi:hypothetical protein